MRSPKAREYLARDREQEDLHDSAIELSAGSSKRKFAS